MNLFKGLLFLQGHITRPEFFDDAPHYGAATAVDEFGKALGNGAASRQWFGASQATEAAASSCPALAGGACE